MELKESRTYANLMSAFAGESQARVKYGIYGEKAREEGYQQIGDIFDETSHNEKAHAELWLKYIHGGSIPSTLPNLQNGVDGEHFEWSQMYKEFAEVAKQEGFPQIALSFEQVAKVEAAHEKRYQALVNDVNGNQVFKKVTSQTWICRNCGFVLEGVEGPPQCPLCKYPQAFFEVDKPQL